MSNRIGAHKMVDWKNTDPRHDLVGLKHAKIIILRPSHNGHNLYEAGTGDCEMKHSWAIWTSFDNPSFIGDDNWNPDWYWSLMPDLQK